jgi:hypothetical protein
VAKRWQVGSGVVMAVSCFLVLSAWQWLPHTGGPGGQESSWQALLLIASLLLVMGAGHSACETLIYTLLTHLVAAWPLAEHKDSQGPSMPQQQQRCRQQQEAQQMCQQGGSSAAGLAVCGDNTSGAEDAAAAQAQVTQLVMVLYVLFWVAGFSIGAAAAGLPQGLLQQQATCWAMGAALLVSSVPVGCLLQQPSSSTHTGMHTHMQ